MFICMTQSLEKFIGDKSWKYDAIVVEGYDGVGKGKVLSTISKILGVTPYRPDYSLWQKYDHRVIDRWKVSGFFWDVYSHFHVNNPASPMLFDRGVISGAVYNNDENIARDYRKLLGELNVLHILVTCTEEDYYKFMSLRGDIEGPDYKVYEEYTDRYKKYLGLANVPYTIYENHYKADEAELLATTCAGCGHYNHGWCRHPIINCKVDSANKRCNLSRDKEVQDIDATAMHGVSS